MVRVGAVFRHVGVDDAGPELLRGAVEMLAFPARGTDAESTTTKSTVSPGACRDRTCKCRSVEKPAVSPGSGARLSTRTFRATVAISVSRSSGTRTCGMTLENHDPGPRTTMSAASIARTASGHAGGFAGSNRTRRTLPGVVATATCPRMQRLTRGSASRPCTSASISSAIGDIGSTRPSMRSSRASSSKAATGSPRTSVRPASMRFPTECPARAPIPRTGAGWCPSSPARPGRPQRAPPAPSGDLRVG